MRLSRFNKKVYTTKTFLKMPFNEPASYTIFHLINLENYFFTFAQFIQNEINLRTYKKILRLKV